MKASIGLPSWRAPAILGAAGCAIGWNDHQERSSVVISNTSSNAAVSCAAAASFSDPGQGAPILTQRVRSSICRWESFFSGGIVISR